MACWGRQEGLAEYQMTVLGQAGRAGPGQESPQEHKGGYGGYSHGCLKVGGFRVKSASLGPG